MNLRRRRFLQLCAGALAAPAVSRFAHGQAPYPSRPVRLLVGFPPGSAPDIMARVMTQWLSERFGQQFIVDNRPGAASSIAVDAAINAPPDGYTVIMVVLSNILNATLYPNLKFNFLRDIAPVAGIADTPYLMLINPSVPAKTVAEFVAYAKANPGKINMASGGNGSASHVFGELFKMLAKVDIVHIPYRANYIPDMISGQVQLVFAPMPQGIVYFRSGELRALGVSTPKRLEWLPEMPAIAESVPGYDATGWYGLGGPQKMPPAIVKQLNDAMGAALADEKLKARLIAMGVVPMPMSPAESAKFMAGENEKWSRVIKETGIRVD
jgi:tripartite-type tricarboxylate transporter receptor subunit TctC